MSMTKIAGVGWRVVEDAAFPPGAKCRVQYDRGWVACGPGALDAESSKRGSHFIGSARKYTGRVIRVRESLYNGHRAVVVYVPALDVQESNCAPSCIEVI